MTSDGDPLAPDATTDSLPSRRASTRAPALPRLGVIARAFALTNQGRPAPDRDVRVELTSPGRAAWSWGIPPPPTA